jgi:hypothetical protein
MLAELCERDATGEIARIYDEIRRLWGVPYVSSLQRHLATKPGWLEWAWAALGPAFTSGTAQTAAWRAAESVRVPRLPPLSSDALAVWGVDGPGRTALAAACASFVRVAPVNLVFAGLLRRLLAGARPAGPAPGVGRWTPPAALGALPALADPGALPPAQRAVLERLGTETAGELFIPGLYRMLAGWPGYLAHVATVLRPQLDEPVTRQAGERLLAAVDAAIPDVLATLPAPPTAPPMPAAREFPDVIAALDTYRKTSPEMVVSGRMLGDALPAR